MKQKPWALVKRELSRERRVSLWGRTRKVSGWERLKTKQINKKPKTNQDKQKEKKMDRLSGAFKNKWSRV